MINRKGTILGFLSAVFPVGMVTAKIDSSNPANNYYFPTAKYRYLPRIYRAEIACDKLAQVPLENEDWERLLIVWDRMDDATTAMPLYTNAVEGSRSGKRKRKTDLQKELS